MRSFFATAFGTLLLALSVPSESGAANPVPVNSRQQPNIVFVMLDDMDLWDVGAYGSPDIVTETMDSLAAEGMRFTQYYAAGPVCSPTRTSLLTGHAPARYGVKRAVSDLSYRGIPGNVVTLGEVLRSAGYHTAHIGKWHVGSRKPQFAPTAKGFDESVRVVWEQWHPLRNQKHKFRSGTL